MTTGTETAAEGARVVGGHAVGMPQLWFETWPHQIFWLLVTLVVIYLVLSRMALPRISGVLAERSGTITKDIAAADDYKHKALKAEKAYNDALAQARSDAARIVAEARAAIQQDLDDASAMADAKIAAQAAQSEARIGEIRAGAVEAVTEVARSTAYEIVAALGGKADAGSIAAAVAARLKE